MTRRRTVHARPSATRTVHPALETKEGREALAAEARAAAFPRLKRAMNSSVNRPHPEPVYRRHQTRAEKQAAGRAIREALRGQR